MSYEKLHKITEPDDGDSNSNASFERSQTELKHKPNGYFENHLESSLNCTLPKHQLDSDRQDTNQQTNWVKSQKAIAQQM